MIDTLRWQDLNHLPFFSFFLHFSENDNNVHILENTVEDNSSIVNSWWENVV